MPRRSLSAVLPPVLLGTAILATSGPWASAERTGSLAQPWLSWLGLSASATALAHAAIRKVGHAMAYALFAVLALRATREPGGPLTRRAAGLAWAISVLLATADEGLQSLSRARGGRVSDVLLDGLGALLGILVAVRFASRRAATAAVETETEPA